MITVEPPAAGDRIRTLQKDFQSYLAGSIFIRRQGRTARALPGNIMALEDRFAEPLRDAGLDRERQRMEKISETVEELFGQVVSANPSDRPPSRWYTPRNNLRTLLVGLEDQLLTCTQIVNAGSAYQALNLIPSARERDRNRSLAWPVKLINAGPWRRPRLHSPRRPLGGRTSAVTLRDGGVIRKSRTPAAMRAWIDLLGSHQCRPERTRCYRSRFGDPPGWPVLLPDRIVSVVDR